ncbi:MAG TPA: hypothetical protein VGL65_06885 [Gemmatimonadales bacterium]|jgi:hypothetical protein
MHNHLTGRIRALLALALFGMSEGGAQMLDAVVFHRHPVSAQSEIPRVNAPDHCHSEECDLGTPLAPPPPIAAPIAISQFVAITFRVPLPSPVDAPRCSLPNAPLGSRAPPHNS